MPAQPIGAVKTLLVVLLLAASGLMGATDGEAQRRKQAPPPAQAAPAPAPAPALKDAPPAKAEDTKRDQVPGAKETVQADVSTRNVAVTSSFNGTEIVIFGAVDNSQQPSAESGYYDVVIIVEGVPSRQVVRRKTNVAGLWLNTSSATFDLVPSFYAIASTRPIDEIAPEEFRASHGMGFQHLRFPPAFGQAQALSTEDLKEFREAIIGLKEKQGLYVQDDYGVAFIGRSLFRSTIELPANVTVGPFDTRVYLFRDDQLLSQFSVRLNLEREGIERYLHTFAFQYPAFYGIATVAIAIAAGLLASTVFRRSAT